MKSAHAEVPFIIHNDRAGQPPLVCSKFDWSRVLASRYRVFQIIAPSIDPRAGSGVRLNNSRRKNTAPQFNPIRECKRGLNLIKRETRAACQEIFNALVLSKGAKGGSDFHRTKGQQILCRARVAGSLCTFFCRKMRKKFALKAFLANIVTL